jgi:hypothetical protein
LKASRISNLDFFEDLTSKYARRRFFFGFIALAIVCGLALWLIRKHSNSLLFDVIDALLVEVIAGALIVIVFYSIYVYFIGPHLAARDVAVIRPHDIQDRLHNLRAGTTRYIFWGRSGSYFRAEPLRTLDKTAHKDREPIDIEVLLPDPNDSRLVHSYEQILHTLGESGGRETLLVNVTATAAACAIVSSNNRLVQIRLYLSNFIPDFRVDLSDNGALLTQDDPKKSALYFTPHSEFHEMFRASIRNEMNVAREIHWDQSTFANQTLNAPNLNQSMLDSLGIVYAIPSNLVDEIQNKVHDKVHRYK